MYKFFFLLIFSFGIAFSQTHRFVYEYQYKADSTDTNFRKKNMTLDVNPDEVKFYNYQFVVMDSLNKIRGTRSMMWDDEVPTVVRKRNSDVNLTYIFIDDLFTLESDNKIQWKLSNETKSEGGYQLQKATANFGNRNWTAWFNKNINLNEGPYIFRGLPGLIFEVQDDKNQHHFKLAKSYKLAKTFDTTEQIENFLGKKAIKISNKVYMKMLLDYYENPYKDLKDVFSKNTNPENTYWAEGVQVKSADQFKDLTKMAQERIRKNNNPINLNLAPAYPTK